MTNTYPDFRHTPAFSREDVCGQLQALMPLHGITLNDDCLTFPSSDGTNERNRIRFDEVIYIASRPGFVDVVVRSGHLHILSANEPEQAYIDLHKEQFLKSGISLQEAVDTVHEVWQRMNEAFVPKR